MSTLPQPPDASKLAKRFAGHLFSDKIDASQVPEDLRDLIPWAKYWSIGDDVIRNEVMASMSFADKKAFVEAVSPRINRIDAWWEEVESRPGPVPNEGWIFMMLSQAVAEAELEIYPKPIPPAQPQTPEEAAQTEAVIASIMRMLQQTPAQLAGGEDTFQKLDSDGQAALTKMSVELSKIHEALRLHTKKPPSTSADSRNDNAFGNT